MKLSKPHVGQVRVAYAKRDGEYHILSAGTDAKLCLLEESSLDEVASASNDGPISALGFSTKTGVVVTGDENGVVKSYSLRNLKFHQVETNATSAVTGLSFSPSQSILAVSGVKMKPTLLDMKANKQLFQPLNPSLTAHGMAYDPEAKFLAIIAQRGVLHIWDMEESKLIKKIASLARVPEGDKAWFGVSWHPDGGTLLAVPGTDNDVVMLERLSWDEQSRSRLAGVHTNPVTLVAFSPNGIYAATAGEDKVVAIWDVAKSSCIVKKETPGILTDLTWHPEANEVLFGMESGEVGNWSDVVPSDLVNPFAYVGSMLNAATFEGHQAEDDQQEEENQDEEFEHLFADDEAPGGLDRAAKRRRGDGGFGKPAYIPNPSMLSAAPQGPVRPGATKPPMDDKPFYISYNQLGFIVFRNMGNHNVVEVTLNDPGLMHARVPKLHDFKGYTVGSIGQAGVVFASPSRGNIKGVIDFRPFASWAPRGDWSVELEEGEEAVCVAAGSSFVAAATNTRRLGIFGIGGIRLRVWSLEGAPVALCAHKDLVAVVWHGYGSGTQKQQNLNFMVCNCIGFQIVSTGTLAISPESTLEWIGFSDEGVLATYDSDGVLRIQDGQSPHMAWMPVFEAAKERRSGEIFRIIGVRQMAIACIVCPQNRFPQVHPPPVVTELPMRLSGFAPADRTVSKLEDDCILRQTLLSHKRLQSVPEASEILTLEGGIDSTLLKLFHEALKADHPVQAFHIATGICEERILQGALALANHHAMVPLADRLTTLLEDRMQDEDDDEGIQADEFAIHSRDLDCIDTGAVPPLIDRSEAVRYNNSQENVFNGVTQSAASTSIPPTGPPSVPSTGPQGSQRKPRSNPFARKT